MVLRIQREPAGQRSVVDLLDTPFAALVCPVPDASCGADHDMEVWPDLDYQIAAFLLPEFQSVENAHELI